MPDSAKSPVNLTTKAITGLLQERQKLLQCLYEQADASRWALSTERFTRLLVRSAAAKFGNGAPSAQSLEEYLGAIYLGDLALAGACSDGLEAAWEFFLNTYQGYLRSCAGAMLKRNANSPEVRELADSLFAELYGLRDNQGHERSLFRYFHGRSSLKTWLRAVLAQRRIDGLRAGQRFAEMGDQDVLDHRQKHARPVASFIDPHRQRYLSLFSRALNAALKSANPQDVERLRLYYTEGKKLAEIGRLLGEHESSASRHLDRVRGNLRNAVEQRLRLGSPAEDGAAAVAGLSDAEITQCFEYAAEGAPIDLDRLFRRRDPQGPSPATRDS